MNDARRTTKDARRLDAIDDRPPGDMKGKR